MDTNQTIETPTTPPPAPQSEQSIPQMPAPPSKPSSDFKNSSGEHKNRTGLFVVVGIIVVLVALIGAAFWYLNTNQKQVAPQTAAVNTAKPTVIAQPTPEDFSGEVNNLNVDSVDTSDIDKDLDKLQ